MSAELVGFEEIQQFMKFAKEFGIYCDDPIAIKEYDDRSAASNEYFTRVGQELLRENLESLEYRYGDVKLFTGGVDKLEYVKEYKFEGINSYSCEEDEDVSVFILKLIDYYEYQACEHDGYYRSWSKTFIDRLRKTAISKLPFYDDMPWGL